VTALIIILGLLILLSFLPVYVEVRYDKNALLAVKLLTFNVYKTGKSGKVKNEEKSPDTNVAAAPEKRASALKGNLSFVKDILFELFGLVKEHIVVLNVSISYTFGFSDAAVTGIFSGVAHAVINAFMAIIDHTFKVKDININITPDFNKPGHNLDLYLKIRIFAFQVFIILFNLVKIALKNKKAVC
jgi:hypothetical protein